MQLAMLLPHGVVGRTTKVDQHLVGIPQITLNAKMTCIQ